MKSNEESAILLGRQVLSGLAGMQFNGERDVDTVCGYTTNPKTKDFQARYDRRGLASTIVDEPAKTSWRKAPIVSDGKDESTFTKAWDKLRKRLNVYHYMERADRLSGIGSYGILLIGSKSGELEEPLTNVSGPEAIIFVSPFSETHATVKTYVTDIHDKRFGQPEMYRVQVGGDIISTRSIKTKDVHWTRVIHIAEGLLDNEVMGEPRLRKVFNRLQDLDKIVGGAAEGFWQVAAPNYSIGPKKDFELSAPDIASAKAELQKVLHGLQRFVASDGIDIEALNGQIGDPTAAFEVVISLISGKTGIPKRILLGSERGELASSQDQATWLGRISSRQTQFVEPMIVRAFINRLTSINGLPKPLNGEYGVEWPDLFYLDAVDVARARSMNAIAVKNITGEGEAIVSDEEKRVMLGLPEKQEGTSE